MSDGKKTEAEQELLRMFGTEEEQKMTLLERTKMKLVANGYKDSTIFFKMFFDKWYRRERHDAIVNKIDDYKNINEFRTMILHRYATMPVSTTQNLYVFSPPKSNEVKVDLSCEDEEDGNILLEKRYLRTYWDYFRISIAV